MQAETKKWVPAEPNQQAAFWLANKIREACLAHQRV
jgi:hypothetical protein